MRTISTVGLGLGALALKDRDDRADRWLARAEASARKVFNFFLPDGSYFEGVSYSNTLRDLLHFCEAHQRVLGSIDWSQAMNFSGYVDFICALQLGRLSDGRPDIVNFSDAKLSVNAHGLSWIAKETGKGSAQYAAEHFCENGHFMDLVWFDAQVASVPPSRNLLNYRSDLDWVVVRSGWQANDAVLALRSGLPQNHEHADRNCLIYKGFGERLLNDPKGAAYSRDDAHWVLRLTQAHNGVLIAGRGHQYHEGEEGTNASRATARLGCLEEDGERVWFYSDATPAYQLEHPSIRRVDRTVAFAKPELIFLPDRIHFEEEQDGLGSEVELRLFPDNEDGKGVVRAGENGNFQIE